MASRLRLGLSLILAASFGTGCASIVKKPEIHQVHKVAIVSVTAPQRVPHKSGKGQVAGWDAANRVAIADAALAVYASEFKKLGWDVIPSAQLAAVPAYKENFEPRFSKAKSGLINTLNTLATMDAENTYFSPTGLYPVVWEGDKGQGGAMKLDLGTLSIEKTKSLQAKMQELAAQAGADAAVLVQADYCYDDGGIYLGNIGSSTGTAVLTGASAIYAITPKGVEVIKMKRIEAACGGHREKSDTSTAMVMGNLLFNSERIQKMFHEVAVKTAAENVKQIRDAMKD